MESNRISYTGLKWWTLLAALSAAILPFLPVEYVQAGVMNWLGLALIYAFGLLVWWLFFSNLAWSTRLWGLGGLVLAFVVLLICFRLDGTSGDLHPRLVWRFSEPPRYAELSNQPSTGVLPPAPPGAADFLQFLGSNRDCHVPALNLDTDWTKSPPEELWRIGMGEGWGGFVVRGGCAITQEQRDDKEHVVCYELLTGKVLWSHADEERYSDPQGLGGSGPRATPTIHGDVVLTMGGLGRLNCLELATGKVRWTKAVLEQTGAKLPEWGVSCSPLVFENSVVVAAGNAAGATLASFALSDGLTQWTVGDQEASYSSPVLLTVQNQRMVLYFGPKNITGHDPASGKQLWSYPWIPELQQPHVALPLVTADQAVVISSGYGKGSSKISLTNTPQGWVAEEVWKTNRMKAKFTNLIEYQNHLYGLDDGTFACLDLAAGKLKWREGKYLHGQCLFLEPDRILVTAERGYVALVQPSPEGLKEIAQFQALDDANKTWNPPALAGQYLLVRNNREAACFRLKEQASPVP
jgi:outer membrane protein assembly factor BamB